MQDEKLNQNAKLFRMVMPDHLCPSGLKAKALLEQQGYEFEDVHLSTREQVDAFKVREGVQTTPQIFIDDVRIGGYDDLLTFFGKSKKKTGLSNYQPVIALFSVAALLALSMAWVLSVEASFVRTIEWFIAISMVLLGLQKLQDIERFATLFLSYDLLAKRWVRYGYIYPFVETGAGLLMIAGALTWVSAPAALTIATIGAVSVYKAVYIDRKDLKCACVGGDSRVPLGFVSLTENLMMIGMAIWMMIKWFGQ